MSKKVKLAIAGVGNCASSLLQGLDFYQNCDSKDVAGLMHPKVGPYGVSDIEVVAAFDVDSRKVGRPLHEAIFAKPNCTTVFHRHVRDWGITVHMGPVLDGIASHMSDYPDDKAFRLAQHQPVDVSQTLRQTGAQVLVCYLPVGSEQAVRHYAQACLDANVAMVNCVPVFIASDPDWADKFRQKGLPIVGDDIKSQFGATILHRVVSRTLCDRGVHVNRTYQLNTGGNTDFLNMLQQSRLQSKKVSKTESVQSQLDHRLPDGDIHIGPSDFVPWQNDNKVCFLRVEWSGFGNVPMHLEARLSVEDSPNSAGVAIDAIRCAQLGIDRGLRGPIEAISACTMKHPPKQMRDSEAHRALEDFLVEQSDLNYMKTPQKQDEVLV
ncbi:MAG: inositol-3-phosphate synthase [Myxococcota bacterium]